MSDPREQRRGVRTEVLLRVEYDDPGTLADDYLTNLGSGGLFVRSIQPLEVGSTLSLTISMPGFLEPLTLSGVVRWRRLEDDIGSGEQSGMGIELDLSNPITAEIFAALTERLERPRPMTGGPLQLLLVEDNQVVIGLFTHAIRKFSKERSEKEEVVVTTAGDGAEALEILRAAPVHLAIVDQILPVLSGPALIRQMRAEPNLRAIPVLAVSAGGEEAKIEALKAGADIYLDKPVTLARLVATLRTLIALRS
ncbi:MAG: response regulator [Deltaproteobacteria bacterium]|nr:response regulator [Deltaproteobacteria bacterium]